MNLSSLLVINRNGINAIKVAFNTFYYTTKRILEKNSRINHDLFEIDKRFCFGYKPKCEKKSIEFRYQNYHLIEQDCNEKKRKKFFEKSLFIFTFFPFILFAKELNDEDDEQKKKFRRKNFNFIADAVQDILPSLVQIEIKPIQNNLFKIQLGTSGSGFIVSDDGLIITNAHVIRDGYQEITVKLNDQRHFRAKVINMDRFSDLAVLKIECENLKPVKFGNSNEVRTGEFVIALGSPLTLTSSVTSGVVSNPFRDGIELGLGNEIFYIQTDAMITHGNSGGPLINLDGEVIGINNMKVAEGISFSIPSKYAIELLDPNKRAKKKKYKYIGTKVITLTPQLYSMLKFQSSLDIKLPRNFVQGCLVIEVEPNSPAEKAQLQRGDMIISANETKINNNTDLFKMLRKTLNLNLIILRDDQKLEVNLEAEEKF